MTDLLPCALPCALRLECFDIMKIVFVVRAFDRANLGVWQLESVSNLIFTSELGNLSK